MKAGIITFHDANNYGAVLQAYALNSKMNEYCKTEIINYYNPNFHVNGKSKGLKGKLTKLIYGNVIKRKNDEFSYFRKEKLNIKNSFIKAKDLPKLNDKYDLFISGSDQIWNLKCSGGDDSYFLNFVKDKNKKNSYSASFGTNNPKLDEKHMNYIKDFNKISVREKSGENYLKANNVKSIKTCDPVFLLEKEKWESMAKTNNARYILVYEVVNGVNMINFAKRLSKLTGLKILVITSSNKPILGIKTLRDIGPIRWLELMKNAEYIITNSFHGLAFSLIFNKQFFIELLSNSDSNTRMLELLDEVKLKSRLLKYTEVDNIGKIQFNNVNKTISDIREDSIRYIESLIEGEK